MPTGAVARYKSPAQRARVASEDWGEANLYCCSCECLKLRRTPPNSEAVDFTCPECRSAFQLKSQSGRLSERIVDAGYAAMRRAIVENRTPNLVALHYDRETWEIRNVLLVPRFVLTMSAVERRKPLASTARRAGWIGCNILLSKMPVDAKISLVDNGVEADINSVREKYAALRPLDHLSADSRGWTLDVLRAVRSLDLGCFSIRDVYRSEVELKMLHPANRHVKAKIRQQLQRLRDLGFLEFLGAGTYRVRK